MNILSLFSGIGGLELGLEWAGLGVTRWQVEQDAFARQVLAHHWPEAQRFEDVREVTGDDFTGCDVICGGFPCQDISTVGKGAGIDGERSGLWSEYARLVRELRPRLVIVENVAALAIRGLDRVLGDLAALGYDAEWEIVSARDAGAPHLRRRLFIVAADPHHLAVRIQPQAGSGCPVSTELADLGQEGDPAGAYADRQPRKEGADRDARRRPISEPGKAFGAAAAREHWRSTEPPFCTLADGIPGRLAQLRALGNAVVPQVGQIVGQRARLILDRGCVSDDAWELNYE